MSAINTALLAAGLLLQIVLLYLLLRRRTTQPLYLFTILIAFYVLRSILLFALFKFISSEAYATLYSALSLADLALQLALAVELSLATVRSRTRSTLPAALLIHQLFLIPALITGGIAAILPGHSPVPADRGTTFSGLVFLTLWGWSLRFRHAPRTRAILAGLATIGIVGALSQAGRTVAASQRNAQAFRISSYFSAIIYLLVLLFWIARIYRAPAAVPAPRIQ